VGDDSAESPSTIGPVPQRAADLGECPRSPRAALGVRTGLVSQRGGGDDRRHVGQVPVNEDGGDEPAERWAAGPADQESAHEQTAEESAVGAKHGWRRRHSDSLASWFPVGST
jgi:hypothetical protein